MTLRWIRPRDAGRFTHRNLARYKVVIFLQTTGTPIRGSAQRAAFQRFIRRGGGYFGVHAASDTRGGWPWYERLVGTRFARHDPGVSERAVDVVDRGTAATRGLPAAWARTDEWYEFRSDAERAHVLAATRRVASAGLVPPLRWRPLGVHRNGSYEGVLRRAAVRPTSPRSDRDGGGTGEVRLCAAERVLARACVLAVLVLAGCGGDEAEPPVAEQPPASETAVPEQTAPPADTSAPPTDDGGSSSGASPAINSVTVDPGDGTIMVGAGPALYRVEPGKKVGEEVVGQARRAGTVSGNLVVRFAGPNDLLASGHPKEGSLPENIGLIRSKDHGDTWTLEDGVAEADYHEVEIAGDQLIAVEVESPDIKVSRDGGRSWEARTPPDAADRRRRQPRRPGSLGGLDRAGHVRLDQRRAVLAPPRHDVRGAADLAERRLALQHRSQRADSCQQGRRTQLRGPRRGRWPAERSRQRA